MSVVVDDQLALLINLRAFDVPGAVQLPVLTVYSFQLRIASALLVERRSEGQLQRLVASFAPAGLDPERLVASSDRVRVVDPTTYAGDVARLKAAGMNALPAEIVAVARSLMAQVRLAPGNARGALWDAIAGAGVDVAVWEFVEDNGRLAVEERSGPWAG